LKQTDAIFAELKQRHDAAAADPQAVRVSYDAKAAVKVGPFARGGYSRSGTQAADHDFKAVANLTPAGVFEPASNELDLTFTRGKVTSDLIADVIEGSWTWTTVRRTRAGAASSCCG
jgi:hypothetical protein